MDSEEFKELYKELYSVICYSVIIGLLVYIALRVT
jgi:hypothetical protein